MSRKIRKEPFSIQQSILDEYKSSLADKLIGLIFCGSVFSAKMSMNDVDYLVVVDSLEYSLLPNLFDTKQRLEKQYGTTFSDTVVTLSEINHFSDAIKHLDGKAAQALLEATLVKNKIFTAGEHSISIPTLEDSLVRDFSEQNFYTLSTVLRKHLIRSNYHNSLDFRLKLLKLIAIILKMKIQYIDPGYFMKTDTANVPQDKEYIEMLKEVEGNKGQDSDLSDDDIYTMLPEILDDSLFVV